MLVAQKLLSRGPKTALGAVEMVQNEVQRIQNEVKRFQELYLSAPKPLLATCRRPKWNFWRPWAVQERSQNPNKVENTSPKGPKRGPKEVQEVSQDHFNGLTLKIAQPLDFTAIYDTKCMSELPKSSAKTAKLGPSDHFFTNLKQSCSEKRSKSAQEGKKCSTRLIFCKNKKVSALQDTLWELRGWKSNFVQDPGAPRKKNKFFL